jgi:hypothetical protein
LLLVVTFGHASAQTSLGSFTGDTVVYDDVAEDSGGLFGTPTISGDTLDFSSGLSASFEAESSGGGSESIVGRITAEIGALNDARLTQLDVEASGSITFIFAGGATADTDVTAVIRLEVEVLEAGGVLLPVPVALAPAEQTFASATFDDDGEVTGMAWGDILQYDLEASAAGVGITQPVSRVAVQIDTTLTADSNSATLSKIDLRGFDTLTLTIPEPGMTALLLSCLPPLLLRRRS